MQVTWEAVIALVTLIVAIVAGGSLYVRMTVNLAVASLIQSLDARYARIEDCKELETYARSTRHDLTAQLALSKLEIAEIKGRLDQ